MKEFWNKARHNRAFMLSLALMVILILIAALGELALPNDPYKENFEAMLSAPGREFLFGSRPF